MFCMLGLGKVGLMLGLMGISSVKPPLGLTFRQISESD
jgi:hypothetical protein